MPKYYSKLKKGNGINLSQVANTSTAIVSESMSLVDSMKALANYIGVIRLQYNLYIENARTRNIVNNTTLSDHLPKRSHGRYCKYYWLFELLIKN